MLWIILVVCVTIIPHCPSGSWLTASSGAQPGTVLTTDIPMEQYRISSSTGIHSQLDLPRRTRYIHRGSGRRFVVSKHGDHSNIASLWMASRHAAPGLRHQSAATGGTVNSDWYNRKPGVDHSVLRPCCNKLDLKTHIIIEQFNVQSLSNKSGLIHDHILDKGIDILCLSETWQQPDVYSSLNEACPPGYCYLSKPRTTGQGGGACCNTSQQSGAIPRGHSQYGHI